MREEDVFFLMGKHPLIELLTVFNLFEIFINLRKKSFKNENLRLKNLIKGE